MGLCKTKVLFELGKKKPKAAATTAATAAAPAATTATATTTATASSCYMKTPEIHPEFPDISDSLFSPCAIPPGVWIFRSEFPDFLEYVGDCNIQTTTIHHHDHWATPPVV